MHVLPEACSYVYLGPALAETARVRRAILIGQVTITFRFFST